MSQAEPLGDDLSELAALYALCRARRTRLRVGPASVGWGLLGASHVAEQRIIPAIRRQPAASADREQAGAWVAAIFSHNEQRARTFADANQIATITVNLADLLERRAIQCVYVSSHPRQRFPLVMAALAAGKHVLCEPPLALSAEEAQTLILAAADRGLLLGVNFSARANPAVRMLRQWLIEDALGDVLGGAVSNLTVLPTQHQTWRLQAPGGGILYDRTIHDVDLLRFLLGDEIAKVYAAPGQAILARSGLVSVAEELVGQVRLARRGIIVQLHEAFFLGHRPSVVVVDGTHQSVTIEHWYSSPRSSTLFLHRHEQLTMLDVPMIDPFWFMIHKFQQAIIEQGSLLASGEDNLQATLITQALHESMRQQAPVWLR